MRAVENFLTSYYSMASPWVAKELVQNAFTKGKASFFSIMNSVALVPGWQSVFGELFQLYAIHLLQHGGEFEYRWLQDKKGSGKKSQVKVPELPLSADKFVMSVVQSSEFDDLESTALQTSTLYSQKIGALHKLAAADAIVTPSQPGQPAYLIQITGGLTKKPLSQAGVKAVQMSLGTMLSRLQATEGGWSAQNIIELVLVYLVPDVMFRAFTADPTSDPNDQLNKLPRIVISFPMAVADVLGHGLTESLSTDSNPRAEKRARAEGSADPKP